MTVKVNKIYHGSVSVRDYKVKECLAKNENLVIEHEGKQMTVLHEKLRNPFQIHKKPMTGKFDGKIYYLCDFYWKPDAEQLQGSLF